MKNLSYRDHQGKYRSTSFFNLLIGSIIFTTIAGGVWYFSDTWKSEAYVSKSIVNQLSTAKVAMAERKPDYEANAKKLKAELETKKDEVVNALCTHGVNNDKKGGEGWGLEIKEGDFVPTFDPSPSQLKAGKCTTKFSIAHDDCFSFGKCQIKVSTAQYFQKELGDTVMGEMETLIMLHDEQKSKEFAKKVIFGIKGSISNWTYATNNWEWFNTRITDIREQEKFIEKLEKI